MDATYRCIVSIASLMVFSLLAASGIGQGDAVLAQDKQPTPTGSATLNRQPPQPQRNPNASGKNVEMQDGAATLSGPPDLPDVPPYSGRSRFNGGITFGDLPGGPAYILHYIVREPPEQVLEWYKSSLPSYGWKLKRTATHSLGALSAHGHHIDVHVRRLADGQGTDLELTYRLNEGAVR